MLFLEDFDDKIFELREQGKSYNEIAQYFNEKGISVNYQTIRNRCKRIYDSMQKEEPKVIRKIVFINSNIFDKKISNVLEFIDY